MWNRTLPAVSPSPFHLRLQVLAAALGAALGLVSIAAAQPPSARVTVDFSRPAGRLRPLHGINKGPLGPGGLLDLTERQRQLELPYTRLHDCHWPNPDVVDIHAVFPRPEADPSRPESYDFRLTDEYLAAVRATGAGIVYRLGESIEHTRIKRYVHPPADPARWSEVALGIIRHYNEGWANGYRHDIRYWEIWNEPENRPACWTGTDADYYRLYRTAATAIKTRYPALKVGGPAVGNPGELVEGRLIPTEFVRGFLELCRRERLPLDFFSWHCYTDDPAELVTRAREVRRLLDSHGFRETEIHLNEWSYLPDRSWAPLAPTALPEDRQRFYERMAGAPGAAFIAAALIELQDSPVTVGNLFHGEAGGFGLFSEHGVPYRSYHAVDAFRRLLETPERVASTAPPGVSAAAGLSPNKDRAQVLISSRAEGPGQLRVRLEHLPWNGPARWEVRILDRSRPLQAIPVDASAAAGEELTIGIDGPTVVLVTLRGASVPEQRPRAVPARPAPLAAYDWSSLRAAVISGEP
ncbi:MAG: GH39 family glycosyl hydrolase [Armatimonadota bacterium]